MNRPLLQSSPGLLEALAGEMTPKFLATRSAGHAVVPGEPNVVPLLLLLDLKLMDPERHRRATVVDNALIHENARRFAAAGLPLWIRTPVILGYTDDDASVAAIGAFIRAELPTVERWDLLAYTNLGRAKYHRLDLPYTLGVAPLLTSDRMQRFLTIALSSVPAARWSGAVRPAADCRTQRLLT